MKFLKLALVAGTIASSVFACATPEYLKKFKEIYSKPNADCLTCHTSPPKRNAFGKEVEGALDKTSDGELTLAVLQSIEKGDADGDGSSNIDEIKGNTKPGDATSKPAPTAAAAPPKPDEAELVPKHSFHPALVHFPIGLLAFAAFLEIFGKRKSDPAFHRFSVISLAVGLICSLAALITGVVAWLRLGYAVEGNLLFHLILASLSVIIGFVAYAQREKPNYLWLILICGILVMVAGHFGGNMVYG